MAKRPRTKSRERAAPHAAAARASRPPGRGAIAAVLVAFALIFGALEVGSYTQKSAVWDEPIHMTDAYASLAQHDYRVDPEHPPFLRMWAAVPLLFMNVTAVDLATVERTPPGTWARTLFSFCERFLYVANDADRLLYASRFMMVILGIALGVLVFAWAHEWLGFWPAVAALAGYTIEPNIAAHASLVTTDFGMACFMFGSVYFLWRTCRKPGAFNVAGLVAFFVLTVVSKFSAVVLVPILVLLVTAAVLARSMTVMRGAGVLAVLGVAAWVGIWAVYGFRYAPSASPGWLYDFRTDGEVVRLVPGLTHLVTWVDGHHLLPNVFTQGFLIGQAKAQERHAFLAGSFSNQGWWYYFPVAFLIKTPIAILLLAAGGGAVAVGRWRRIGWVNLAFVIVPIAVFMASAMLTHLNIGVRHVLPIYPFVLLLGALAASALLSLKGRRGVIALAVVLGYGAIEFGRNYPDHLAFFNAFVGGPSHGAEYLVDSNLDWGQDLKPLKKWMDAHHVSFVNLAYFGTADPAYYHINCTYLPGSAHFAGNANVELPGYVAVSATLLNGVYLGAQERAFYQPFQHLTPSATIGHSINVYWMDQPWW